MYPFFILDLPQDASGEDVELRYHELVRRYPPDRASAQFAAIRTAYEALSTEESRQRTRLFYVGEGKAPPWEIAPDTSPPAPRRRLSEAELARLICGEVASGD